MDKTLLPCPFCGGEAAIKRVRHRKGRGAEWISSCKRSACCGRIYKRFASMEKAIDAWNTRAQYEIPDTVVTGPKIKIAQLCKSCRWNRDIACSQYFACYGCPMSSTIGCKCLTIKTGEHCPYFEEVRNNAK